MSGSIHLYFGEWLKQRRREAGINQDELAERIACSAITLRKIEAGERQPSRQIALLLADLFNLPADEREAFVTFARTSISISTSAQLHSQSASDSPAALAVSGAHLAPTQAPWRAALLRRSNLPLALTSFIGREGQEEAIRDLLTQRTVRLLTLVGAPGIGKTRLSLEVAARPDVVEHFEDGVFLVELAPISDPALVMPSIAKTLGLKEPGMSAAGQAQSLEAVLLQYLQDKRLLLVLDNFEQVLDAAPGVVGLLAKSPWVKVLVTSREPLHVRGERRFPVPPLELPALEGTLNVWALSGNPAVALFVERAQEVLPNFDLTQENVEDVARVCVGLDGLPLAIELAAARADVFSPEELRESLGNRLKLLTEGARDLPARHRTLRSAIEWSYDLLGEGEKQLFRRMAVFQRGRTLPALQEVCNYDQQLAVDMLKGAEGLISKSLLHRREGREGEARFRMLETIHEYAREKLEESGEAGELRRQHALYFMKLSEEAEPHLREPEQLQWLDRLEEEHDNIRAALQWTRERGSQGDRGAAEAAVVGLRIAGPLWYFWLLRGTSLSEGREQLEAMLSLSSAAVSTIQDTPAPQSLRSPLYSWSEKQTFRARALNAAGRLAQLQGSYDVARPLHEECLTIFRTSGDRLGIAESLNQLGMVAARQGDYTTARSLHEESLALQRGLGDKAGIATSLNYLGTVAGLQGDYASARLLFEEGLALRRELKDRSRTVASLGNIGNAAYAQEDYVTARHFYREGLDLCWELADKSGIAWCLAGLGGVAAGMGQAQQGAKLLAVSESLLEAIGRVLNAEDRPPYEGGVASARAQLGEEAFDRAWQEGRAMSMEEAIEYALSEDSAG